MTERKSGNHGLLQQARDYGVAQRAEGFAEGETAGVARGKAEAILAIFKARGITVSDAAHARILECKDVATLEQWLARAVTAGSADEVLRKEG
ncbi:MAG TPA: hypothetical protein VLS89_01745 [Candidatus Nanopelagicales bacterium]|nr:hypothetical protein [Candidatus Nanopelagicales bacterium]